MLSRFFKRRRQREREDVEDTYQILELCESSRDNGLENAISVTRYATSS